MELLKAVLRGDCWMFLMFSVAILQMAHTQQQNLLQGSSDTFVDPFGSVVLECRINPTDLPSPDKTITAPLYQWRFRKTGQVSDENLVTWGSAKWIAQPDIMNIMGDQKTGVFNLQITNVTYDSHDGDYVCEVNIPGGPGSARKVFRSKPFHLYVKYQPLAPQVDYSVSPDNLREEQRLTIACSSREGNPPPAISWMRDGVVVQSTLYTPAKSRQEVSKAELVLDPLTKEHNKAVYVCAVSNPAISNPILKTLEPLNVKYKPRISVTANIGPSGISPAYSSIVSVEAGTEVQLSCSVDANPPASIPAWHKNHQVFQPGAHNYTFHPGTLTREAAGVYSCVVSNEIAGEQAGEIKIDVLYAPVVVVVPPVLALREGSGGSLRCQVDSNPPVETVEWYNSAGNRIAATDSLLVLGDMKRQETGLYECRVKLTLQPTGSSMAVARDGRGSARVDVQYKPGAAVIEPTSPRAFIGSRVSLKCSALDPGLPAARFRWRKLDGRNGSDRSSTGEYFNISEARLDDNGEYECTPTNDVGDGLPKTVTLEVSEPVSWTTDNPFGEDNIIRKISDKPLSLNCGARGRPPPQFRWLKDGTEILETDQWYRIVTAEPGTIDRYAFVTRSELKFEGAARTELFSANDTLQRTDRGRYTCKAVNDAGQAISHETHVLIQYPPEFRNQYSKVATDLAPSYSAKIECLVESRPPATISWSRNGQPVLAITGRIRIEPLQTLEEEVYKSTLTVDSPNESDLGDYRCSATNLIGDSSKNLSLVRRGVPDAPKNLKQKDVTFDGVTLSWEPGFDGGHPQTFTVVMTKPDGSMQEIPVAGRGTTNDSEYPSEFRVTGLLPLASYNFRMKTSNQLGQSKGSGENLDISTPAKPVVAEDIPKPLFLRYDGSANLVTYGVKNQEKPLNLCALIEAKKGNEVWTPVTRCIPLNGNQGSYTVPGPPSTDFHPRIRFCLNDRQDICGEPADENTVFQASTMPITHLEIILPIVIIGGLFLVISMIVCIVCKRRAKKAPVKTIKTSNMTLSSTANLKNGSAAGFYADGYTNKALQEQANGGFATQNGKLPTYAISDSHYGNGALYAQVDKKHNGDLVDGRPYTTQVSDGNGNLYSDSPLYLQSYASYDDGYGHQHSPLDPNYTQVPAEVSGLPDPYEEYEKTPSFGEESVESGYSTSNSRGRRVIREIIV